MITPCTTAHAVNLPDLHAGFLAILPRIQRHAHVYFRHLRPERKQEMVAEVTALAWKWYRRLIEHDKDVATFPSALATYAARAAGAGRRLCGQERAKDVLSPLAQRRYHFTVCSLPRRSSLDGNVFDEALRDNTQTPPDEQVMYRIDFDAWRKGHTERTRRIIDDLMCGERTSVVADRYGVSAGRISQMRSELHDDWERFGADAKPISKPAPRMA